MSNEEIYIKLELKYPKDSMIVFARMNSDVHYMKFKNDLLNGDIPSEHEYDANWWNDRYNELKENNGSKRIIREISKSNIIT